MLRHFITFQKKKALFLEPGEAENATLAHEINHELMAVGYVLNEAAFNALASQSEDTLRAIHGDLVSGISAIIGDADGYEPIYRGFPQSVLETSYEDFFINAILHYWSRGSWRPEDAEHFEREFKREPVDYTPVGLLTQTQFERLFHDLLYGGVSLSSFDKRCLDHWIEQGGEVELGRIRFNETAAWVGQRLLDDPGVEELPTRNATTVLRIWSACSGGDEGLKENTRFSNPSNRQRRVLMRTLDACTNLEDSFKGQRERWLRLLFYLHPQTAQNAASWPTLASYADRLRNRPKTLRTFQSRVEELIENKDPALFDLLAKRPGAFMRRLDHLVRTFGVDAIYRWLELELRFDQLVTAYNHFATRAESKAGRAAVLAGAGASEVVTYAALEPLPEALVEHISSLLLERLRTFKHPDLAGPVHVDPSLYFTPLATNNRASQLSLDATPIGTCQTYEAGATLRLYVHWEGKSDIDLSGFAISNQNQVQKIGWNAAHHNTFIVYSGDNTGLAEKNAEYLDINTPIVPEEIDWIIVEARIFRGPETFAGYGGAVHIGWMSREHPEANRQWLPETLSHAAALRSEAKTAYLMAYHPASRQIVYLDVAMGGANVSTPQDAMRMRIFLESIVELPEGDGEPEISWKNLKQGHILELLSGTLAGDPERAEVVFSDTTTAEEVASLMETAQTGG